MTMEKEKLDEIIENHVKWLQDEGGKRAYLRGADLRHADLCGADFYGADLRGADFYGADLREVDLYGADLRGAYLRHANLHHADLRHADLYGADLSHADLCGANLREAELEGVNLSHADLCYADLCGANLRHAELCHADLRHADLHGADLCETELEGANLPVGVYQIVGPGRCNRCTTYDVINDQIVCGCWNDGKGNHLDSFIKRIEMVYGPKRENPGSIHYAEYMAAVNFFKAMKELKENHDRQRNKGD